MLYEHSAAVSPKPKTLNDSYQKESIMNSPNANQPMIYTSQKKPLRLLPIVLGALGVGIVLVVLAVAVGIKIFHGVQKGTSEATAVGNSFIDYMGNHNYAAAYALFSTEARAGASISNLKSMGSQIEDKH